ncbi:hypothetical protein LTR62_001591 [Meristemomyces frigidus]|uniref:Protein kinase domain-containing protein n=1 Tax=Meristemomyces frigidus TaxID=1508187 RepID=A0AAN7YL14_9PEZI|nr:hypothetical protein LTR62_001591 [Meristemomyces frigidus]
MTDPLQRRFRGSAKISEYDILNQKLGEGTFGVVSKARSKRTGAMVALKKILMHNEKDGFPITALREVKLLKMLSHVNILHLEEMAVERQAVDEKGKTGKKKATLYMVMPYMDHDLSGMLTNPDIVFKTSQIKCYMQQLLEGLRYLHDAHILHRDMKAANILISNKGILQIADFGLARHYEGETPRSGCGNGVAVRDYTSLVVTRWYRPPELLLTLTRYTPAIDLWGVGCIFAEMFEHRPILEGKSDVDQCHKIFALVGNPTETTMPGWSQLPGCDGHKEFEKSSGNIADRFGRAMGKEGLDLLKKLLRLDWRTRINAVDALKHEYFTTEPLPSRPEDIPRYEDSHELDARRRGNEKQRNLPPAPAGGTVGMGPDEWHGSGPPPYQNGYGYRDRGPQYGRDNRGPPPNMPPRGYDDRRGARAPSFDPQPPSGRRPQWQDERDRNARPTNGHALPPRPVDPLRSNVPSRDSLPPRDRDPVRRGGPDVDVYIPNYSAGPDRPSADRAAQRNGYRDADGPPRGSYRDHDPPPPRYRDNGRDRGGHGDARRTRSRSPNHGRDGRDDHARRERTEDRERDYNRR